MQFERRPSQRYARRQSHVLRERQRQSHDRSSVKESEGHIPNAAPNDTTSKVEVAVVTPPSSPTKPKSSSSYTGQSSSSSVTQYSSSPTASIVSGGTANGTLKRSSPQSTIINGLDKPGSPSYSSANASQSGKIVK